MGTMLTINPHKRKAKKKRPSAAQLAARKRFAAMARARAKAAKAVKSNPKRRRKARKAKSPSVKRNPSPAMAKRKSAHRRRRSSGFKFFRRKAKRNPIVSRSFVTSTLSPAAIGALGATFNDAAVGYLVTKLPATLQAPEMRQLVKGVSAVGLAALAGKAKIASSGTVKKMLDGALTCALHDAFRTQAQKFLPSVPLGEYLSEVTGPWPGMIGNPMGEQISCWSDDDADDYGDEDGLSDPNGDMDVTSSGMDVM